MACGKLKERVEITWPYEGDAHAMPTDEVAERMEVFETALRKAMEKDKLAILTAVYTGGNARVWVFYTRTVRVFGERLNEALASHEAYPISIYTDRTRLIRSRSIPSWIPSGRSIGICTR